MLLIGGLIFVAVLLHISQKHGSDPHKRLKLHEDMGIMFPPGTTFEEKQRLLDRHGLVPNGIETPLLLAVVVIACFVGAYLLQG